MKWVGNHIEVEPPKNPLKITGTRLAAILGSNKWTTPFSAWCEITRTYKKPFVDTIYTVAGKTIEPKQAEYMKRGYSMLNIVAPKDLYGNDHFKTMRGDFFHDNDIFGGMWDFLLVDENDVPTTVLEMKTTKRIEDWQTDIPEYYALQAALYAYLLGIDKVMMVASALDPEDYEDPDSFRPSIRNTILRPFLVSQRYPNFKQMLEDAEKWWNDYVVTGISPDFDEKADAEILKELRTNHPDDDAEIDKLMEEAEDLMVELETAAEMMAETEKRLDTIKKTVKEYMSEHFREGDTTVSKTVKTHTWTASKSITPTVDKDAMKRDGIWEKYTFPKTVVKLTTALAKKKKEDK